MFESHYLSISINMQPTWTKNYPSTKIIWYHPSQSDRRAARSISNIQWSVKYLAIIISNRAYTGKKENAKIDSPRLLQITRVVQGITSPLIVPRTYYTLLLWFLSYVSGEIIMVSFERTTNLITSPNRGRKARLSSVLWVRNVGMRLWTSFLCNEIFQFLFSLRAPFFNHFLRKIGRKSNHMMVNVTCNYADVNTNYEINRCLIF